MHFSSMVSVVRPLLWLFVCDHSIAVLQRVGKDTVYAVDEPSSFHWGAPDCGCSGCVVHTRKISCVQQHDIDRLAALETNSGSVAQSFASVFKFGIPVGASSAGS